jgi:hypothetical protein
MVVIKKRPNAIWMLFSHAEGTLTRGDHTITYAKVLDSRCFSQLANQVLGGTVD